MRIFGDTFSVCSVHCWRVWWCIQAVVYFSFQFCQVLLHVFWSTVVACIHSHVCNVIWGNCPLNITIKACSSLSLFWSLVDMMLMELLLLSFVQCLHSTSFLSFYLYPFYTLYFKWFTVYNVEFGLDFHVIWWSFLFEPEVINCSLEANQWLKEFTHVPKCGRYPRVADFQHKQNFPKTIWNYLFGSWLQMEAED